MYVAEIPNRSSPPAILLRESFRQDGKVKNRTIANLSSWPAPRIAALRRLLRGELYLASISEPTCAPVFGLLHAPHQLASDLAIPGPPAQQHPANLPFSLPLAPSPPQPPP